APSLVDTFEELENVLDADDPERADRQDQPEAIHEHGSDPQREHENERVDNPDRALHAAEADNEQDEARDHLDDLPDPHLPDAHQDLRVLGLGQQVVERSLLHVLHEHFHVRLDEGVDEAAEQDLHSEQGEQLRFRPAVELVRVRVHEREHHEPGPDLDQRLEELHEEVDAVLQLVHDADLEIQPGDAERVHAPTAEKRLMAARHANLNST